MKLTGRITLLAALIGSAAHAAPFLAVGDNAELFLTGAVAVRFDDNIFTNTINEVDDTIVSFTPGLDLTFGKGSATQGNIYYREDILRYSDASDLDTSLSNAGVNSKYDGGKTTFDLSATYAQLSQNDNNVRLAGDLVDRDVTHLHVNSEFGISDKSALAIRVSYDKTNYQPATFSDYAFWSVPIDFYTDYTAKLRLSAGYRYRSNDVSRGVDSDDSFFNIGARGEFTPKLSGQVRVGYNLRSLDVGGNDSGFGIETDLAYAFSDKTTYRLNVSNDFSYAGTGAPTEILRLGLNAANKFTEQWSLNAGLTFTSTDYPDRTDDYLEGLLGVTYTYSTVLNFAASYTYRDNNAGTGGSPFTQTVWSFGANIRY